MRWLHHHEGQSVLALAQRFNIRPKVIGGLLDAYGIPQLRRPVRPIDAAWLRHQYITHHRPLPDIATELELSKTYLNRRAKAMGIPLRPRGGTSQAKSRLFGAEQRQQAQELLTTGNYAVGEVAKELGFTARTLYRHIEREHWSKAPTRKRPRPPHSTAEDRAP